MNKYDLLGRAFYDAHNQSRSQKNMDVLVSHAGEKSADIFDPYVLERSIENREYINEVLFHNLIQIIKEEHNLPPDFKGNILFRDRDDFSANMEREAEGSNEYVIFIDDLLDTFLSRLVLILLYWNDFVHDIDIWTRCFKSTVYTLTEFGIRSTRPACPEWVYDTITEILTHSGRMTSLLADVMSVITSFIVAHEIGHFVLGHQESSGRSLEQECAADDFAYKTILSMIEKQSKYIAKEGKRPELDMYSDYTYLTPLLFFDFMQLLEFFRNTVYNDYSWERASKELAARKTHLGKWVFDSPDVYDFETTGGNAVYNAAMGSIERFTSEVILKRQRGKKLVPDESPTSHFVATKEERKSDSEQ